MSETDACNDRTILDYLNEDCWCVVLQYVPVQDLIRTEPTSRLWQSLVLMYLQGARISVVDKFEKPKKTYANACTLKLDYNNYESFAMWTSKLGSSVVGAYCNSYGDFKIIHNNCPNLEILMLLAMNDWEWVEVFPYNLNKDFNHLQGLYFYSSSVSDKWIKQFIADKALEELEIRDDCYRVKGDVLNTTNLSNLKSLALGSSDCLDSEHLLAAIDRLTDLTKLVLTDIPFETSEAVQRVLDKMSKLEHLELCDDNWLECNDYEPLSRLSRLKFLRSSFRVPDEGVEMILEGCKELRTLELLDCRCLSGSLMADILCRHGTQLRSLKLKIFHCMEDDDLVAIIRDCPELTLLTITAANLSPALPARAAAARSAARPGMRLLLDLSDTILVEPKRLKEHYGEYEPMQTEFEVLSIKLSEDED